MSTIQGGLLRVCITVLDKNEIPGKDSGRVFLLEKKDYIPVGALKPTLPLSFDFPIHGRLLKWNASARIEPLNLLEEQVILYVVMVIQILEPDTIDQQAQDLIAAGYQETTNLHQEVRLNVTFAVLVKDSNLAIPSIPDIINVQNSQPSGKTNNIQFTYYKGNIEHLSISVTQTLADPSAAKAAYLAIPGWRVKT
jgi:hypothetical protein